MLNGIRFRRASDPEPTLAEALRPVLFYLGMKLALMSLMRYAIRQAVQQRAAEGKL